jgi:hypothetical protein
MNPLQSRLAALRRRLRMVVLWRGLTGLFALLVGAVIVGGFLDWYVNLPTLVRALLLVGILGSAGYVGYRFLIEPLLQKCDDLTLALKVEDQHPELNDALASTVQFLQQGPESEVAGSATLRREAVQRALRLAQNCDFGKVIDSRGVYALGLAAVVAGSLAAFLFLWHPDPAETAVLRLADPFGNHTWTRLNLANLPSRVAQGQPYVIRGTLGGVIPAQAKVEVEGMPERLVAVKTDAERKHGSLVAPVDMTQQKGKFRFRVLANDATYPPRRGAWHEVDVVPPPKLVMLDGLPSPQIELRYPAYTDLPSPLKLSPGNRHVQAVTGTHVTLRAAADRKLQVAWIEYVPEDPRVKPAAYVAPFGSTGLVELLASGAGSHQVWGRFPARLDADGLKLQAEFMPWVSGSYNLRIRDHDGIEVPYAGDLRVVPDPVPTVNLERPAANQSLLVDAEITLKVSAEDETFGLRSLFLQYRRRTNEGQWLDPAPRRLDLSDPILAQKPRRHEAERRWKLQGLAKEGEILVIQACADDFNDVFFNIPPGRSHEVELRIVGRPELAKILDEGLAQVQQELVRVQQLQEDALKMVKEVQKNQAKPGPKDHDRLIEAEQLQKQIQERLGAKEDEGLRNELKKLQQLLRDNKLPQAEMHDRVKSLLNELQRLAQEDLQQVEQNLIEARRELGKGPEPKAGKQKADPGKQKSQDKQPKGALDQARQHQEDAQRALDDLVRFLDPWANMHLAKGKARDLLAKQQELKKETEKLQKHQNKGMPADQLAEEVKKIADAQSNLADRAQDLEKMLTEMAKQRRKQDDLDNAKLLEHAGKVAQDAQLPEKMRDVKNNLENKDKGKAEPQFGKAIDGQKEAIANLEKIANALEGRREDDVDRLLKKHPEAQDKLQKLVEKLEKLQKKVQDAKNNPDELKKLAKEQAELQKQVEEQARELAKLQANKAGQELNRAAKEMERAARMLQDGQDPEEAQDQAMENLENAQQQLQEAEEELAREQLARIADNLKALKERQDSAIVQTEDMHKRMTKERHWTRGLRQTLLDQAGVQRELGQEAKGLQEKLKDAKVFAHILKKTEEAMTKAADKMKDRNEAAGLREEVMEKEELKDEDRRQEEIVRLQKDAARRLQRLVDALKNEPNLGKRKDKKDGGGDAQAKKEGENKLRGPGDGIPEVAQLKVLRDEQKEVNDRTKDFAERHPEVNKLNEEQRAELDEIQRDQARIHRLFEEITAAPQNKEDNP